MTNLDKCDILYIRIGSTKYIDKKINKEGANKMKKEMDKIISFNFNTSSIESLSEGIITCLITVCLFNLFK